MTGQREKVNCNVTVMETSAGPTRSSRTELSQTEARGWGLCTPTSTSHWTWAALREEALPWTRRFASAQAKTDRGTQLGAISSQDSEAEGLSVSLIVALRAPTTTSEWCGNKSPGTEAHVEGSKGKDFGLGYLGRNPSHPWACWVSPFWITGLFFRPLWSLTCR